MTTEKDRLAELTKNNVVTFDQHDNTVRRMRMEMHERYHSDHPKDEWVTWMHRTMIHVFELDATRCFEYEQFCQLVATIMHVRQEITPGEFKEAIRDLSSRRYLRTRMHRGRKLVEINLRHYK